MSDLFLLDTSTIITAYKSYYSYDVFPSVWVKIEDQIKDGRVLLSDKVFDEVQAGGDEVSAWISGVVSRTGCEKIRLENDNTLPRYLEISRWAKEYNFRSFAINEFFRDGVADPWLCAFAVVNGAKIVCDENFDNNFGRKHIYMPNVCQNFDIPWIRAYDMFRALDCMF